MRLYIISVLLVFTLACSVVFAEAGASREAGYRGIWVADGIAVEICREDEAIQCRAVFSDGSEESDIWEYYICLYDETGDALQCFGVTRTRERFDSTLDTIEELDWSMDDMDLAELRFSEGGLLFTDDKLDEPIALTQLNKAERSRRNKALAFAGQWIGESCVLRTKEHRACYQFTVTLSVDSVTSCRWTYTCLYDPDSGRMASVNISPCTVITREADGGTTEAEEDIAAGDAEFILEDESRLIWKDMTDGEEIVFGRIMD